MSKENLGTTWKRFRCKTLELKRTKTSNRHASFDQSFLQFLFGSNFLQGISKALSLQNGYQISLVVGNPGVAQFPHFPQRPQTGWKGSGAVVDPYRYLLGGQRVAFLRMRRFAGL